MERRNFLKFLAGGASAAVAPSLVWPFRKFFLPAVVPASAATLAEIERIFRETMHWKQEQIMMDFYLYGMATYSLSGPRAQYRIENIRVPKIQSRIGEWADYGLD